MKRILFWCMVTVFLLAGCGGTVSYPDKGDITQSAITFPPYEGPKTRIAVMPVGLSPSATVEYPAYTKMLRQKGIGSSMWHYLDASLQKTGRFEFEHIPEGAAEKILEEQWFGQTEMVDPSTALKLGQIKQARYFVYGTVIGFWPEERKRTTGKDTIIYHVTIAIRYVDGETLEYISSTGEGTGPSISAASSNATDIGVFELNKKLDDFIN